MVNGMVLTISTSHRALLQGGVLLTDEIKLFFPQSNSDGLKIERY